MENKLTQNELRSLSGLLIITLTAADVLQRKLDHELRKYHRETQRDVKKAVADSLLLAQKLGGKLEFVMELGMRCGEVDGSTDPCAIFDALLEDAGDVVRLAMEYENARKFDETALVKLISYAKTMATGEPIFSPELIASITPKI